MNETTETTNPTSVNAVSPVKRRRAPSAKRAATKAQKEQSRGFPLPLYLTCPVTNKTNKYTSLSYIRKLIAKYGSVEELRTKYVSIEGRKQQVSK
jgi:hypothetical protein